MFEYVVHAIKYVEGKATDADQEVEPLAYNDLESALIAQGCLKNLYGNKYQYYIEYRIKLDYPV